MHISDEELKNLAGVTPKRQEQIFSHIAECDCCAARLAELAACSAAPHRGFDENIEYRINLHKKELLAYSLRVAVACAASVVIVFTASLPRFVALAEKTSRSYIEATSGIAQQINKNLDGGLFNYENKKK